MKWEKMGRKQRRVAVAKHAIDELHTSNLTVGESYMGEQNLFNHDDEGKPFGKEDAKDLMSVCTPCARGCLMLTKVAKFNHARLPKYLDSQAASRETLADCFTVKHLELIESAYEGSSYGHVPYGAAWPVSWKRNLPNKTERFMAICQNIIDNKGDFKPHQFYEVS